MNAVSLSQDGRTMTIRTEGGGVTTLHSTASTGFAPDQVAAAAASTSVQLQQGQINRARRFTVGGREVFVHVNTGPPTWWWPRVEVDTRGGSSAIMAGWLRGLAAIAVGRAPRQ